MSHKNYWMCADDVDLTRSQTLKRHLDDHFEDKGDDAETIEQLPVAEVSEGASVTLLLRECVARSLTVLFSLAIIVLCVSAISPWNYLVH